MVVNREKYQAMEAKIEAMRNYLPESEGFKIDSCGDLCAQDGTPLVGAESIDEVFALLARWIGKK